MTYQYVPPLRHRFLEDMRIKGLQPKTQTMYLRAMREFTRYLGHSPDSAPPCPGPLRREIGMRGELRLDRAGRTEGRIIERGQVFLDRPRHLLRIDLVRLPIRLGRRVLPVRVSLNDAGACRKALAACQSLRDAAGDHRFEQMAQQIAVSETAVSVLGEGRVIRHRGGQIETAEME